MDNVEPNFRAGGASITRKTKVRFTYGVNERQFRNLFEKAAKLPGNKGIAIFLLESGLTTLFTFRLLPQLVVKHVNLFHMVISYLR